MLSMYTSEEQDDWDKHLPYALFAYRTAKHSSTGYTPFYLVYGHDASLTIDTSLKLPALIKPDAKEYVETLQKRLARAHEAVRENIQRSQQKQTLNYDKTVRTAKIFEAGDLVWQFVHQRKLEKTKKLAAKWEGPFEVVEKVLPVNYKLRHPGSKCKAWIVHVSKIKPYTSPLERPSIDIDILSTDNVTENIDTLLNNESHSGVTTSWEHSDEVMTSQITDDKVGNPQIIKEVVNPHNKAEVVNPHNKDEVEIPHSRE